MNRRCSYAHGTNTSPLLGETIGDNFRRTASRVPDREALVVRSQGFRATFREIHALVDRAAKAFLELGIQIGDRIGIWAPNRHEWVVAQYGAMSIGAIVVNVNPSYQPRELEYALNQSGVKILIHAARFKATDYSTVLESIRGRCPTIEKTLLLERDWSAFLDSGSAISDAQLVDRMNQLQFDEPINIQYTSGTTGLPKGATLTHHCILNNAWSFAQKMAYTEADRVCVPVPFYHCFGMVMGNLACTASGACIVVPAEAFDPLLTLETVQEERCTSLYGVPTMFIAELDHPRFDEFDLSSLRTGAVGGSLVPSEVMKKMITQMNMPDTTIIYGMTETSPVSTMTTGADSFDNRVSTVGLPMPHVEIRIVDPATGRTVPFGEQGEFCTRGYHVMPGYWENEKATRASIDSAGWMHTGDLAVMDESRYTRIVGRLKDMIIRGGENIYPKEIEEVLMRHRSVSDAQVIGIPSEKYGEEVMAWVRTRPGVSATQEELVAHCETQLSRYKIPRYWKFTDAFPMTVTGKIQKFRMRELASEELGLKITKFINTA